MPIGAAALLLFRGGGGVPSHVPVAVGDPSYDLPIGSHIDVDVVANDVLFGSELLEVEIIDSSAVTPTLSNVPLGTIRVFDEQDLIFSPPAQSGEHVIFVESSDTLTFPNPARDPYVSASGQNFFPDDQDVTIVMPPEQILMPNNFLVQGGRNIRIIGGNLLADPTVENPPGFPLNTWVRLKAQTQSVFWEGLRLDMQGTIADAIVYQTHSAIDPGDTRRPDVYLQTCRIFNVNGSESNHADVFQGQNLFGRFYGENIYGHSQWQGLFLVSSTVNGPVNGAHLRKCDMRINPVLAGADGVNRMILIHQGTATTPDPNSSWTPVIFEDFYVEAASDVDLAAASAGIGVGTKWHMVQIQPTTLQTWGPTAAGDDSYVTWPDPNTVGIVQQGPPPGGDIWAPESAVGANYVSPWGTPTP